MLKRLPWILVALPLVAAQVPSAAGQVWISDILANPPRFWNTTVTVAGQVQNVNANPPGTTRGTYTLLDDSSTTPLVIRTRDLPPVGREFVVNGVIVQDPAQTNVPLMNEIERTAPGASSTLRTLLFVGGGLFVALLAVLIVLMNRSKPTRAPTPVATPLSPPPPIGGFETTKKAPAGTDATRKISSAAPAGVEDKTKVFMSLGAEVLVEKGPDTGRSFPLHKQITSIGRAGQRKNDIELSDDTVSKEQASILYDSNTRAFSISNESKTNPTTMNGSVVTGDAALEADATIQLGSTVLRFKKE